MSSCGCRSPASSSAGPRAGSSALLCASSRPGSKGGAPASPSEGPALHRQGGSRQDHGGGGDGDPLRRERPAHDRGLDRSGPLPGRRHGPSPRRHPPPAVRGAVGPAARLDRAARGGVGRGPGVHGLLVRLGRPGRRRGRGARRPPGPGRAVRPVRHQHPRLVRPVRRGGGRLRPDVLTWYMERVFPVERRLVRLFRPVVSRVTSMPVAGDGVFDAAMRLYERLGGVRDLLSDGERTSIRLVVNPEKMVIAEAKRTATYLSLFGYHVDAVVANRLLPEAVADPWFKAWKAAHADHLASIEESFAPLPVLRAELAPEELVGRALLSDFANDLYGECDPAALMHSGPAIRVEADGGERVLVVPLPFVDRDDLEIGRREDELLVRVGPYRRAVTLPDSLRRRQVTAATITDGALQIRFQRGTE